ncbi:hypothetical protein HPB52_005213 [Rhipicephalus sanguineus]|uniref:Tc1-like transposase DDE domain-containing protein n=1 Tax=Rhipicephalus sanguineus TaxID=34632 RepID=A0A9D4SRZ4_RHISA|nr:hypothetical protein HPB52_005213 [Rhipicephalus sanguineus]
MTGRSVKAVNRILQAFKKKGRVKDAPRGLPPRATTDDDDLSIVAAALHGAVRLCESGLTFVSVWACISKDGLGALIRLQGRFTAERYGANTDDVPIPYVLDSPFPKGDCTFQHDRSPIPTARVVRELPEERGVTVMEWPPLSPDLNITENFWGLMKMSLARHPLHGLSEDRLRSAIVSERDALRVIHRSSSHCTPHCRSE